ncbi:hypothetical protein MVA48_02430 [Blastococcus sp. PRF04-17]|nr:hypothetical protein [Blastococcus sp. PRF04-17]UOY02261.1 hypothetical protein MVA48_02430 [Blastococcus sp. PRF04-17]
MSAVVHGVSGAGLSTTVLPAASAPVTFASAMSRGMFHGVIAPTTPIGVRRICRTVRIGPAVTSGSSVASCQPSARPAMNRTFSTTGSTWTPVVRRTGQPSSVTIASRRSWRLRVIASANCSRQCRRKASSRAHTPSS